MLFAIRRRGISLAASFAFIAETQSVTHGILPSDTQAKASAATKNSGALTALNDRVTATKQADDNPRH